MSWRRIGAYVGLAGGLVAYARIHTFGFEHAALLGVMIVLGSISARTRDFLISVAPIVLLAWLYSFMGVFSERAAEVVSIEPIYRLEQTLFGWMTPQSGDLGPVDFFRDHHLLLFDAIGGLLYAMHMPAVILFGIYLWWRHDRSPSARVRRRLDVLMWGFLFMSAIGLVIQAVYPVAPPWYPEQYGFEPPRAPISGDPAALARVDAALGIDYFEGVYSQASYVFGALPSLHVASPVWLALNVRDRLGRVAAWLFAVAMSVAAVYLTHHYILDVLAGVLLAVGVYWALTRTPLRTVPSRFHDRLYAVFFSNERTPASPSDQQPAGSE